MKTLFKIYFQNKRLDVWLDNTVVELLSLRLRNCGDAHACHFVIQRWLGVSIRQRFGHLAVPEEQVKQWVKHWVQTTLIG